MVASPLPHREHRHLLQFYVAPQWEYGVRLACAGGIMLIGFAIQLLLPDVSIAVRLVSSLPLLLIGNGLLLVRGYNLRPASPPGKRTWEKTTRDRFTRMRALEKEVQKWDESFTDLTCVSGVAALFLVGTFVAVTSLTLASQDTSGTWMPVFVADAVVLLAPHWITGTRRGWRPIALRQTVDALEKALQAIDHYDTPPSEIQPLFEMAAGAERRMPTSARVFIRFPEGPDELLGLQFQVSLNNVQGTNYPYLYAVLVADKKLDLIDQFLTHITRKINNVDRTAQGRRKKGKLTIEASREDDVDVIVIRQHTTKRSGYHTKPAAIRRIARAAWHAAQVPLQSKRKTPRDHGPVDEGFRD